MMRNAACIALVILGVFVLEALSDCPSTRNCDGKAYSPVCDRSGKEYKNKCALRAVKDCFPEVDRQKCPRRPNCGNRQCPKLLKPVCSNAFETYENLCLLEAARDCDFKIAFLSDGRCPVPVVKLN